MPGQRTSIRGLLLASLLLPLAISTASATSTIGLYTDQIGSSCSFSGNNAGIVTAYVVVKPDAIGIRGVRFSAVIPPCFGAVFIDETPAPGNLLIGESATGVSVAFAGCGTIDPMFAMQIRYQRSSTTPCCELTLTQDPYVGMIEGVVCDYTSVVVMPVPSHFNADASCPCLDPTPPHPPTSPSPMDFENLVGVGTAFSWVPSSFDTDIKEYDIYIGTTNNPGLAAAALPTPTYQPVDLLLGSTRYYWKVVVRDLLGFETAGPVWTFTTRAGNLPPSVPTNPSPANSAVNVSTNPTLTWQSTDPNGDPVRFDVYIGTASPPPLVATNIQGTGFTVSALALNTRYFWKIVARDNQGALSTGPIWSFTTRATNFPPAAPTIVSPASGATGVSITASLNWDCSDPDGDVVKYDVYAGTSTPPPLVLADWPSKSYPFLGTQPFLTTIYWKIVARDATGAETSGPVWSYTTAANQPPTTPTNPFPPQNATAVSYTPVLTWSSGDELPGLTFDVYFGDNASPPLVASNITTKSYTPGTLAPTTAYYWRIVARDAQGATSTGLLWTFYTAVLPNPYQPNPADNGFAGMPVTLGWLVSKPNPVPVHSDVYFGTTNPPPLVASGLNASLGQNTFSYTPPAIVPGEQYYWQIYGYDSFGGTMGPVWHFTGAQRGDVDLDGSVTLADAACALQIAIKNPGCAPTGGSPLADVNCLNAVTPRDAVCIHRRAIGQTCGFCGDLLVGESLVAGDDSPEFATVTLSEFWQVGNTLYARLAVSGVPSLEAFSFQVNTPSNAPMISATRFGATSAFTAFESNLTTLTSNVGCYTLNPVNVVSQTVNFVELHFTLNGVLTGTIFVNNFTDDLTNAGTVVIATGSGKGGGGLPVIFSRFDATTHSDGIRLGWEIRSDDAMESYTLYRGLGDDRPTLVVAQGPLTGVTGSYLDRDVEAGEHYRYEMLVRTTNGDEFRSQIISVGAPAIGVSMGRNHPNPFNPQTTIPYSVPASSTQLRVRMNIYDASGRLVRTLIDENQSAGNREVVWKGDNASGETVSSGVYLCVLQVGKERRTQKLVMLK